MNEDMEYNCGIKKDNKWFRYRAAAIIVEDGCVLFAGNEREDYYYSIGGAVHMGETAKEALYFLMKPRGTQQLNSNSYTLGVKENMYWLPIDKLDTYKAFPSFMKTYLQTEHSGIEHIITDERVNGESM